MTTETKLPPIHPGEVLNEEFLVPMNITQYRLAKVIGVDARRIHSIVHGQRSITAETALLLARFFGNSPGFWMGLQSQYDLEVTQDRLSERLDEIRPPSVSTITTETQLQQLGSKKKRRTTRRRIERGQPLAHSRGSRAPSNRLGLT